MTSQKYQRLYDYIHEYQRLIYDFYSKDIVAFLTTYYHISSKDTIWENENLFAGSYDRIGEYSGIAWDKILLLPGYYIEEVQTVIDGQEIGLIKENDTNLVIPSTYGFIPMVNDKIKFEQSFLKSTNDSYPIFNVGGIEKTVNADKTFYKLKLHVEQSITLDQLDEQVSNVYTFFDYDKKIHTLENAQFLSRLLIKNEQLKKTIKTNFYDPKSGFYFSNLI